MKSVRDGGSILLASGWCGWLASAGFLLLNACGAARPAVSASSRAAIGNGAICKAMGELSDVEASLEDAPDYISSSAVPMRLLEHLRIGSVRVAVAALDAEHAGGQLPSELRAFEQQLSTLSRATEAATGQLYVTYAAAEAAMLDASVCKNVHIASLRRVTSAQSELESQYAPALNVDERRKAQAILQSPACAPQVRLGLLVSETNLLSNVSVRGTVAQAKELSLSGPMLELRTRVTTAFTAHAAALDDYEHLFSTPDNLPLPARHELEKARVELVKHVHETRLSCMQAQSVDDVLEPAQTELRRVTLTVRPKWSGKLKEFGGDGGFGSGFVLRWRDRPKHTTTLVVTNRHVMEGALEADLLPGDVREDATKGKTISGRLLFLDPNDDIAILGVEGANAASLERLGLTLRVEPAVEQEGVVAAGFPGAAGKPSFQITKGIVSNSHFEGESDDAGVAYVQHTAPIDPGNSGGPLLDERGRVIGMNTAKMVGRENTNIAIPSARILASVARANHAMAFDLLQARASCDGALSALSTPSPKFGTLSRFGRDLFSDARLAAASANAALAAVNYRHFVRGNGDSPIDEARLLGYELVRRRVDEEGGVSPYAACSEVEAIAGAAAGAALFRAKFRTRGGTTHLVELSDEFGSLRVSSLQ